MRDACPCGERRNRAGSPAPTIGEEGEVCLLKFIGGARSFLRPTLDSHLYWVMLDMPRMMVSAAGPSSTMNMLGKMKSTRGKMILTVVFAAISSAS